MALFTGTILRGRQYGVIYADPAWEQVMYGETGYDKSPQAHYDCMSLDDMKAMRDQILFATGPHCVLFMWAIWNMLPQALDLMESWGFSYKTGGNWDKVTVHGKQAFGNGYILRSSSEPFLIGTLGKPARKNRSTRNNFYTGDVPENLHDLGISISSLRRDHSRKPDEMVTLIEDLFDGPYLELFSRTAREGWDVAGNQTEKFK
jgi:N6-adenosine-specific RNA methylase IME4